MQRRSAPLVLPPGGPGHPAPSTEDPYPFWDIQCSAEKRNRTVHILKNISIVGALTILQQLAKYESQERAWRKKRRRWGRGGSGKGGNW